LKIGKGIFRLLLPEVEFQSFPFKYNISHRNQQKVWENFFSFKGSNLGLCGKSFPLFNLSRNYMFSENSVFLITYD